MDVIFLRLLNRSIAAGWLILAIVVLRFVWKRAPKWMFCILWAMVAVRLICPFSLESALSLLPGAETIGPDILSAQEPAVQTSLPGLDRIINPALRDWFAPARDASVNPLQVWTLVAAIAWLTGTAVMLLYASISCLLLRKRVSASIQLSEHVRICDDIRTPFILGIVKPLIYLPSGMDTVSQSHALSHENTHLKRRDHWWKLLGFLLLAVYWFDPLCWLAWLLFCRDIELACDESVIRNLKREDVIAYSETLLSCSSTQRIFLACPPAFGEVGLKVRIKSALNYKRTARWQIALAIIVCIAVAVCFLTNRPSAENSTRQLTLNDVILLSQKGEALTWSDFDEFTYREAGFGLYMRVYEINSDYSLRIGGGNLDSEPMYIRLYNNTEPEAWIDIRTEPVTDS